MLTSEECVAAIAMTFPNGRVCSLATDVVNAAPEDALMRAGFDMPRRLVKFLGEKRGGALASMLRC